MLSSAQDYRPGCFGEQYHAWQATLDEDAVVFTTHPKDEPERGTEVTQLDPLPPTPRQRGDRRAAPRTAGARRRAPRSASRSWSICSPPWAPTPRPPDRRIVLPRCLQKTIDDANSSAGD